MDKDTSNPSTRRNYIISGDSFDLGYATYFNSPGGKGVSNFLNQKRRLNIRESDYTYRTINHWDSEGLIDFDRSGSEGWRQFSVLDLFWMEVIITLRSFGLSIKQIHKVKEGLSNTRFGVKLGYKKIFEYYVASAMFQKQDVVFIVFPEMETDFATINEINTSIGVGTMPNTYISIGFNEIINRLFPKTKLPLVFKSYKTLTKEEEAVLEAIWEGDISKVEIKMKNGSINLIEKSKITEITKYQYINNASKILNDSEYQAITVTRQGGEIMHLTQTLKVKPSLL